MVDINFTSNVIATLFAFTRIHQGINRGFSMRSFPLAGDAFTLPSANYPTE